MEVISLLHLQVSNMIQAQIIMDITINGEITMDFQQKLLSEMYEMLYRLIFLQIM